MRAAANGIPFVGIVEGRPKEELMYYKRMFVVNFQPRQSGRSVVFVHALSLCQRQGEMSAIGQRPQSKCNKVKAQPEHT